MLYEDYDLEHWSGTETDYFKECPKTTKDIPGAYFLHYDLLTNLPK